MSPQPHETATPSPPISQSTTGTSPATTMVRITHHDPPDLSHEMTISATPTIPPSPASTPRLTTHTLADEPALIPFSSTTFSFANYGPFAHFLLQHSPTSIAAINTVQWEAHSPYDVAGGATLTVARMLVERLPGLQEVVIRLVLSRREAGKAILKANLRKWKQGLKELKSGLRVSVVRTGMEAFEQEVRGRGESVRVVGREVKRVGERRVGKV